MDPEDEGPEDEVHWIWSWLVCPESDSPQKVHVLDLILADGPESDALQKMHVLDLVKTKREDTKSSRLESNPEQGASDFLFLTNCDGC